VFAAHSSGAVNASNASHVTLQPGPGGRTDNVVYGPTIVVAGVQQSGQLSVFVAPCRDCLNTIQKIAVLKPLNGRRADIERVGLM